MNRTNVYLTDAQTQFLDQRSERAGTSRSAELRRIIDEAAERPVEIDEEVREAFASLASDYPARARRLFGDDAELGLDPRDDHRSAG
ncbi:MAG: hypothetical protein OXH20_09105 [bacterium]|nr:hypothetical protein [bacterium]MDE0669412.1 hypothetical protein [bacterium]MXZ31299.1 hypothetical protein [Acidimicrobiia bacterium]MYB24667.1 hypothetical protein [Acidimicrobiia bacterium]MYJ14108.1 hypothetical protein [Acidimicrobiia bacterium]